MRFKSSIAHVIRIPPYPQHFANELAYFLSTGYRCLHQEGVRQEIQSYMALHCWP